jgi:outer membrane lipoprotein-sorting protein
LKNVTYKIFLLYFLLIFGCTGAKEINKSKINSAEGLQKYFEERDAQIQTLTSTGSITIETPEHANNARFELKIKKPDSLLIELRGPFGISVGTLMLSRQTYVFYNSLENLVRRGFSDINSIKPIVNLEFSFDDIINVFTGSYLYSSINISKSNLDISENKFSLKEYNSPAIKEIIIGTENNDVLKYTELDQNGKLKLEVQAKRYRNHDGVAMPYWIRIILPQQQKGITIAYDKITLNKQVNCSFNVIGENDSEHE